MKTLGMVALFTICTAGFCSAAEPGWPQFGGPNANFKVNGAEDAVSQALDPGIQWQRTLGEGMSSMVVQGRFAYATYLQPFARSDRETPASERPHREVIVGLDRATGETEWEFAYDAGWNDDQEAFGGRSRSPQSTPVVVGDRIIAVGFSGLVHCLDRSSGMLQWKMDLVDTFGATPVQFGFSSSPIVHNGTVILLVGGERGGLVAIEAASGQVLWNVPCKEASYATPVVFEIDGCQQIAFVTRDNVVGVDASDGAELWRYALPKPGLTNVPTPLVVGIGRLVCSGQGIGGTRELKIRRENDGWVVAEGWFNRTQFFYCNWIAWGDHIVGCEGDLLVAINADSGKLAGRWRGFANSNLAGRGEQVLVLGGEGELSALVPQPNAICVRSRHEVFADRSWVPPTIVAGQLFCRSGKTVACVQLVRREGLPALNEAPVYAAKLPLRGSQSSPPESSATELVIEAFDSGGAQAAWKVYSTLRGTPQQLTLQDRMELATLAFQQGLVDFGRKILDHAVEDFPEVAAAAKMKRDLLAELAPTPSAKLHRGENGLLYVEFAIRNNTSRTIQTFVQGPKKHPFSYGIPFPVGKVRVEKWPVGTRLYETHNGVRKDELFTVTAEFAGKTIDLKQESE